jgi:hypothetical protein
VFCMGKADATRSIAGEGMVPSPESSRLSIFMTGFLTVLHALAMHLDPEVPLHPQDPSIADTNCTTSAAFCSSASLSNREHCKGTSVHFLTSHILSHSPHVYMYSPSSPLYYLQGSHLRPMTFTLTTQRLSRS